MPETTTTKKPAGAGGKKGEMILAYVNDHPDATRAAVAEAIGCTVQRVGEVVRAAGVVTAKPVKDTQHKPVDRSDIIDLDGARSDADNYKAVMAGETGDHERAVAYAKRTKKRVPK